MTKDSYYQRNKRKRNKENIKEIEKKLKEAEELLEAGIGELKFANMQRDYYKSILEEIESFTDDKIVKQVIKNCKERAVIDNSIHVREVFEICKKHDKNYNKGFCSGIDMGEIGGDHTVISVIKV